MSSATKDRNLNRARLRLQNAKSKMRTVLLQISNRRNLVTDSPKDAVRLSSAPDHFCHLLMVIQPLFDISGSPDSFDKLKEQFDRFFDEAREQDRILNPHPITLLPVEVLHEIFEWAGRVDADAPLALVGTCPAWAAIVLSTPSVWRNIDINTDSTDEIMEPLQLHLHCSRTLLLDITMRGRGVSNEVLNELLLHTGRIRTLELRLSRKAKEPIHVLKEPEGGLASLSTLALERFPGEVLLKPPADEAIDPFSRAKWRKSGFDDLDLRVITTLPSLALLRALVLQGVHHMVIAPVELPKLETLHLLLKESPQLLQNFQCRVLQSLHVNLEDTNRGGWWDLLLAALNFKKLDSLVLDVTLDRSKDDWHNPWDMLAYARLPSHERISELAVTLMFADFRYCSKGADAEYLCGALLEQLVEGLPFLRELHLKHVPFFHAAWTWPSPETLRNLRRLEMNVPANVDDGDGTVIELLNLEELSYYGFVDPKCNRLQQIRAPQLRYLELMHDIHNDHAFGKQGREWNGLVRMMVDSNNYGTRFGNSARDFPAIISKPLDSIQLPILHESFRLVELRVAFRARHSGALGHDAVTWHRIHSPVLKTLHTHSWVLRLICASNLEELYLYHGEDESNCFAEIPLIPERTNNDPTRPGLRLWKLKVLVIYPHIVTDYTPLGKFPIAPWLPHLESVETLGLPAVGAISLSINNFSTIMCENPRLFPSLIKIRSPQYPSSWLRLRDCIEVRNHLAMRDGRIRAFKTLEFPCQVHDYIAEPLQAVLSGRFGVGFRSIPDQPCAIPELIPENSKPKHPSDRCFYCIRSGDLFSCLGLSDPDGHGLDRHICQRHLQGLWVGITGTTSELSGYLQ